MRTRFFRDRALLAARAPFERYNFQRLDQSPMTVPHYISEAKSDMRGIKPGWYAMNDDGNLVSGPFSSREKCVERDIQPTNGSTPSALL